MNQGPKLVIDRRQFVAGSLSVALAGCNPRPSAAEAMREEESIKSLDPMLSPRATHAAIAEKRGAVTILGGFAREGIGLRLIERFDPIAKRFERLGELTKPRIQPLAVAVGQDRILVMAGEWDLPVSTAEMLDHSGRSVPIGGMNDRRTAAAAIRLGDGRVLICGGSKPGYKMTASAELFYPDENRFAPIAPMREARAGHVMVCLADGRVLICGGGEGGRISQTAELFDPRTGRFTAAANMAQRRYKHGAVRLPDGRVLVIGGSDDQSGADGRGRLSLCEFYDPQTAVFLPAPSMMSPRYKIGDAVASLGDGRVVIAGGALRPETYFPETASFEPADCCFDVAREFMTATAIADNTVLATGGYDAGIIASNRAWLISPLLS